MKIIHLAKLNDFPGICRRIDFHDAQWRSHAQITIKNVDAKDDRVPLAETCDGFQTARPNSHRSCIAALRLGNLCVVSHECIKQVVDDIRYSDVFSVGERNLGKLMTDL